MKEKQIEASMKQETIKRQSMTVNELFFDGEFIPLVEGGENNEICTYKHSTEVV